MKKLLLNASIKEKNRYRLQPENSTMEPIYLDNVIVVGKVIGLYREM